jgi:hypothetical protein
MRDGDGINVLRHNGITEMIQRIGGGEVVASGIVPTLALYENLPRSLESAAASCLGSGSRATSIARPMPGHINLMIGDASSHVQR